MFIWVLYPIGDVVNDLKKRFEKKVMQKAIQETMPNIRSMISRDEAKNACWFTGMSTFPIIEELVNRIENHLKMFKETVHTDDYGFCDLFDCDERIRMEETLTKLNDWLDGKE